MLNYRSIFDLPVINFAPGSIYGPDLPVAPVRTTASTPLAPPPMDEQPKARPLADGMAHKLPVVPVKLKLKRKLKTPRAGTAIPDCSSTDGHLWYHHDDRSGHCRRCHVYRRKHFIPADAQWFVRKGIERIQ